MAREQVVSSVAIGANWGTMLRRWATTFELPKSRNSRFVAILIAAVITVMLFGLFGTRLFHWYPIMGSSMQPTIPYLGGYVKLGRPEEIRVNDLVLLNGRTLGFSVKRVAKINPRKGFYVLGDNQDHSMDSSYGVIKDDLRQEVWIPSSEVAGKVVSIWSPKRAWRSIKGEKWRNQIEFNFPPSRYMYGPGTLWELATEKKTMLFDGTKPVFGPIPQGKWVDSTYTWEEFHASRGTVTYTTKEWDNGKVRTVVVASGQASRTRKEIMRAARLRS